jgi:uncharacterized protein (TIGR03437 family)
VSPYSDATANIQFAYGGNGKYRIGAGTWPYPGLNIAIQAPAVSGSGVYLNPTGVVNAASSAPFTAGIAAGELITLYGSNLAPAFAVATAIPFPAQLNGVQVTINNVAAPIYYVSPGQVAVLVPFAVNNDAGAVAAIQLINNGKASNTVTEFVYGTSPGVFTVPPGGTGQAAIIHASGTLVTPATPAAPGEIVSAFVTGLGAVSGNVVDGAVGPFPPANTKNVVNVEVGGSAANTTCQYCLVALAPGEAALYQINFQIPQLAPGDTTIEIAGPDSFGAQATISIGAAPGSAARGATPANDIRRSGGGR